ncbi:MAG: hypothetical protein HC869_12470 [Rhodospirillales bacterium]|nr:hypothetical protein [Rhodospirillales bacterium]
MTLLLTTISAEAAEHIVRIISDYKNLRMMFVPKYLEIEPGDRVTWVNEADEEHNVITFPDGYPRGADAFRSPIMTRAGERFSHQFDVPGTYEYHCIPHLPMGMHGLVIVDRPSSHDEFHEPAPAEVKAYRDLMMQWFDEGEFELPDHRERATID